MCAPHLPFCVAVLVLTYSFRSYIAPPLTQSFMGKYVTTLFRLLLHTYTTELSAASSGGSSAHSGSSNSTAVHSPASSISSGGSASASGGVNSGEVCYLTRLVISLSCALLQSLGECCVYV